MSCFNNCFKGNEVKDVSVLKSPRIEEFDTSINKIEIVTEEAKEESDVGAKPFKQIFNGRINVSFWLHHDNYH